MVRRGKASSLIGKTIKDVIIVNRNEGTPHSQVFILFDDNTHYEFYGDDIHPSGGVDEGGRNEILNYVRDSGAYIKRLVHEL